MSRESDLLFGLLAMQMNFVSKEHLLECAALWMSDAKAGLPELLLKRKFIKPSQHAAVKVMADEQVKANEGDAGRTLAAAGAGKLAQALKSPADFERTIASMRPGGGTTVVAPPAGEERYRLGAELGAGGLGKVVEAYDTALKREVAIKIALDEASGDVAERFVREAELAGRLEHPNIVPVHDFGALGGAGKQLFLCMKRVKGRDLGHLLKEIAKGEEAARRQWSRARLLRVFQDICLGMAFAHDRGVIHRDLKPANVMIGDYGETLIVDWGLARVTTEPAPATVSRPAAPGRPELTLDGDILGTPAYMPPEQAEGNLAEIDHRSDIYSLGAILYEILTLRPPFEGKTPYEIISKVRTGRITPPSSRVGERKDSDPDRTVVKAPSTATPLAPIPPELDAICLKALAFRREDRYQTATELHNEVQLFLEGVKERERAEKEAKERVEKGRAHLKRYRELAGEFEAQGKLVKELAEKVKPHEGAEAKRPLWDAEARVKRLEDDRIEAFAAASAEFGQALVVKGDSREALDAKCELFLDRFLEAEKGRDRKEMLLNRRTLEQYDREGRYRAKLDAPGKVTIRTFAYSCGCLAPIRHPDWRVEIAETVTVPWRDGRPRPDLPLTDKDRPVPAVTTHPEGIRWGHTAECARHEVRGAEVWIAKYEERDKRLQLGQPKLLGKTPLSGVEVPQGSWRCTLKADGFAETLLPVRIDRGGAWTQDVNLYRSDEIPDGFCHVPGGPFVFGGPWAGGGEAETKTTEDLFVARFATTCGEYLEFLNDLGAEEARKRQPREGDKKYWIEEGGRFRLPTAAEDPKMAWDARWPVFSINWFDAVAYCAWRSKRDGRVYRLMHEEEWEKAARGVDGRVYSYGDDYDGSYSHTNISVPGKISPLPVESFPIDESPCGIRGLSGGVETWCSNAPEVPYRDWRCLRGGAWGITSNLARAGYRHGDRPASVLWHGGVRLAAAAVPRTS